MKELLRTNDIVVISFVESLLRDQDIGFVTLDQHMSLLEGSIGIIQRRIMIDGQAIDIARRLVKDAGLEKELK